MSGMESGIYNLYAVGRSKYSPDAIRVGIYNSEIGMACEARLTVEEANTFVKILQHEIDKEVD